ncbi:MAG: type 2 lanthipeptide synthetase LanM family protein [Cyanobacteria bacterium J06600_6]
MPQTKQATQNKLLEIVAKASNLKERIASDRPNDKIDLSNSEARRQQWAKVVGKGDLAKFERRLQWSGIDPERLLPLLGDRLADDSSQAETPREIPSWAVTLERVIEIAPTVNRSQAEQFFVLSQPFPFEDFYLPFLEVAQAKLLATHDELWQKLSRQAQTDMWQGLLSRLANIGAATLIREFDRFRLQQPSLKSLLSLQLSLNQSDRQYRDWLTELMADFENFLLKYSVLGRLLATATDFWVAATADFLTHLAADWEEIENTYSYQELSQVVACQCNLSDSHNDGRSVIIVTFNTRLKVVYKPRDLSLELAFYQLVDWCNEQSQLPALPSLKLLNYGTHGWSEFVAVLPCEDEAEVKRFYQRSGISICLVHILAGQDFHSENLIAKGEFPVLVDLEALLHSAITPQQTAAEDAFGLAYEQLAQSVFKTHLLPQRHTVGKEGLQLDLGGIGNTIDDAPCQSLVWKNLNTDDMQLDYEEFKLEYDNSPILEGKKVSAAEYVADVVWGFEQMYNFVMANKEQFLAVENLLSSLANQKVRFIFRDTSTYGRILQQSYHPDLLEHGIDRSIALDVLSRGFTTAQSKPDYWDILDAEIQSLEQLDIPLFTIDSSRSDLYSSTSQTIPQILREHSFDRVVSNFEQLNQSDRDTQLYFIKSAFTARYKQKPPWSEFKPGKAQPGKTKLDSELLIKRATSIAESIEKQAIRGSNGSLAWLGLDYTPASNGFSFQPLSQMSLGDGNLGIALFLAALAKTTSSAKWQDLAWQILTPIRTDVDRMMNNPAKYYRSIQVGGVNGLAASAYGLIKVAELLSAPSLVSLAEDILSLITLEDLTNLEQLDLAGGCGGTLLSLLGCLSADLKNPNSSQEKTIACGDYLLQHQAPPGTKIDPKNLNYWRGISGVTYGLLRLGEITGDNRYRITAINAIALESAAIDSLESSAIKECAKVEVALGRLGGLSLLNTPQIRTEIDEAIAISQRVMTEDNSLFWGNCGRLEILLLAAQKLAQPQLSSAGDRLAEAILQQPPVEEPSFPSFLHGSSGIGYQLLRAAQPQLLPSILIWE